LRYIRIKSRICRFWLLILSSVFIVSCDRMITPPKTQLVKDADQKSAQGDYLRAINLYESALDGTTGAAEVHYKLGVLYDDKLDDPLNALHHFKRYLTLNPTGGHAAEVKNFMKRDEIALLTNLSGDSVVTRAEAARLRNENLNLRRQIEERSLKIRASEEKSQPDAHAERVLPRREGGQTYVVRPGDTLFSISRKFYKSAARWKEIRDANKDIVGPSGKLQPGQSLTIP
jgi:tetratricopeptide (TPR) repeat protein